MEPTSMVTGAVVEEMTASQGMGVDIALIRVLGTAWTVGRIREVPKCRTCRTDVASYLRRGCFVLRRHELVLLGGEQA